MDLALRVNDRAEHKPKSTRAAIRVKVIVWSSIASGRRPKPPVSPLRRVLKSVPTATTRNARSPASCKRVKHWPGRIDSKAIEAPLPDIAMHVEKPPRIWRIAAHNRGLTTGRHRYVEVGLTWTQTCSGVPLGRCTSATAVLPFGLCRQAVMIASRKLPRRCLRQVKRLAKSSRIVPSHSLNWAHSCIRIAGTLKEAGVRVHDRRVK